MSGKQLSDFCESQHAKDGDSFCGGYFHGIKQILQLDLFRPDARLGCVGFHISTLQIMGIVTGYLKQPHINLEEDALILTARAINGAFPCNKNIKSLQNK